MPLALTDLRPYASFVLAKLRDDVNSTLFVGAALADLQSALQLDAEGGTRRLVTLAAPTVDGELEAGFIHYVENRRAPWTDNAEVSDELHHVTIVCRRNRHVAIYLSDSRVRNAVVRMFGVPQQIGLGALDVIPDGLINAAFVRGQARTLWLGGTHRRTSVKADSKVLTGIDLRDALDPLDDQTYRFTSARSRSDIQGIPMVVGVTPRRSQAWIGPSRDWTEFRNSTAALLARLEATTDPETAPLPVLAIPSVDVTDVGGAFDFAVVPPEALMVGEAIPVETREMLERWAYRSTFEVQPQEGPNFAARVWLEGRDLGTIRFSVDLSDPGRVTLDTDGDAALPDVEDKHREALRVARDRRFVRVWYESGHNINDGQVFEMRHVDFPFREFVWVDLHEYEVSREKPEPLSEVGGQDSLFCWTKNNWPNIDAAGTDPGGWLVCDDRPMETADFVHLDIASAPPVLTLIHVKGAKTASPDRRISVSSYEIVVGQAVKNLRHLHHENLAQALAQRMDHNASQLVWQDRNPAALADMIALIRGLGGNYRRRVVILQPHVREPSVTAARTAPGGADKSRMQQLDMLLLGAESDCRSLGADLRVLAST